MKRSLPAMTVAINFLHKVYVKIQWVREKNKTSTHKKLKRSRGVLSPQQRWRVQRIRPKGDSQNWRLLRQESGMRRKAET